MENQEYAKIVLDELTHTLTRINKESAEKFVELVDGAKEVFCAGAGRSGFESKGFAMRLCIWESKAMWLEKRVRQILMKMDCL